MVGQRISKPTHSVGVTIAVPHAKFTPTPTMTPLEVAFHKGKEAKRLGRPLTDNPHDDKLGLSAEWERGYNGQ